MSNQYSHGQTRKAQRDIDPSSSEYPSRPTLQYQSSPYYPSLPPGEPSSFIPPNDGRFNQYVADSGQYYNTPSSTSYNHGHPPPLHYFPPPLGQDEQDRSRPTLSLHLPPPSASYDPNTIIRLPAGYVDQISPDRMRGTAVNSPYVTPLGPINSDSTSGSGMTEYFPPFGTPNRTHQPISPTWATQQAATGKITRREGGAKTSRQQFTACGACRHRRVKCDLKDRQEQAEAEAVTALDEVNGGLEPKRLLASSSKRKKVSCTNCKERGTNCVDEYAPLKAAKQLRRGKRISEIEMLYGSSAAGAAVATRPDGIWSDTSFSPIKEDTEPAVLPDLTKSFFESPFFRRFQIQRPILDPVEFVSRYLRASPPSAAAMGIEGGILCHVLYAWALSYGVDENGILDVDEGGDAPDGPIDLVKYSAGEVKRENDRLARKVKMKPVLEIILKEIDEAGVMRKPTWDGVRALLMILPLTEDVSSPVERLAMYETAISQVFTLCSFIGMGYDGAPSATSGVNGGTDQYGAHSMHVVRVRIYWYAFVHEGITTGLKGGRLHLDDEDLETMQASMDTRSLVNISSSFRSSAKFATAPINLALACRLVHKALTGTAAKRRQHVNPEAVKKAWEALEACWEEFDSFRHIPISQTPYASEDEVLRFSDGWKIFLFEAQNVILKSLEQRLVNLTGKEGAVTAHIVDQGVDLSIEALNIKHLIEIARSKCEVQTRQIVDIVTRHVGSRFFEWDASLVRDGTYYAAMLHAKTGGNERDISTCIRALNEMRWAYAKARERSEDLRREWAANRSFALVQTWNPTAPDSTLQDVGISTGYTVVDGSMSSGSTYTSPGNTTHIDQSAATSGSVPPSHQAVYGVPAPGTIFSAYAAHAGPPPLYSQARGPEYMDPALQGQYVLQPDGSQVYIPYG